MEHTTVNTTDNTNKIPLTETTESYALLIVKALSLNGNASLLLGCCWMSRDQRRYIRMFPTTLGFEDC